MVRTRISTIITIGHSLTGLRGTQLVGSISYTLVNNSSNPIIIDGAYSLCKDKVGNVFAKCVGAQSGVKKKNRLGCQTYCY
jgi:hypothetical protein